MVHGTPLGRCIKSLPFSHFYPLLPKNFIRSILSKYTLTCILNGIPQLEFNYSVSVCQVLFLFSFSLFNVLRIPEERPECLVKSHVKYLLNVRILMTEWWHVLAVFLKPLLVCHSIFSSLKYSPVPVSVPKLKFSEFISSIYRIAMARHFLL